MSQNHSTLSAADTRLELLDLIENHECENFLADMLAFAAHELMELEVSSKTGGQLGERLVLRISQTDGYNFLSFTRASSFVNCQFAIATC